jgi:hypothetical protein
LAAQTAPKVYGSSTMGVITSTVSTMKVFLCRNTPASSPVPTTTPRFLHLFTSVNISERSAGPSLAAQPAALTFSVSLISFITAYITGKVLACQKQGSS